MILWREGGRNGGRKRGGRERGREGGRNGGRKRGGGREEWRKEEGGREGGRNVGREGERKGHIHVHVHVHIQCTVVYEERCFMLCLLIPVDRLEERHEAILKEKKDLHDKNIEVCTCMYECVSVYCTTCVL